MLREMKTSQRLSRFLAFLLTGTGTAAISEGKFDGTLVDNGTGDYTITFAKPFARAPIVQVASRTSVVNIQVFAVSTTALQIKTFAVDGTTAKDAVLDIFVFGFDSADQT